MNTPLPSIRLAFDSEEGMQAEYQKNLRAGGAFCPGVSGCADRTRCVLVLVHPNGTTLELAAEIVFVNPHEPGMGVGVQLLDFGPSTQEKLRLFMQQPPGAEPDPTSAQGDQEPTAESAAESPSQALAVSALHDRLRNLPVAAQVKLAREGNLSERVALERIFGKSIWEPLLKNPRVTSPEVARIARMGTAPNAVLETISGNAAWLASGEVRRALLSNPRLTDDGMMKVLRATPKPELQQISNQTYYQSRVRKAAKALFTQR